MYLRCGAWLFHQRPDGHWERIVEIGTVADEPCSVGFLDPIGRGYYLALWSVDPQDLIAVKPLEKWRSA